MKPAVKGHQNPVSTSLDNDLKIYRMITHSLTDTDRWQKPETERIMSSFILRSFKIVGSLLREETEKKLKL